MMVRLGKNKRGLDRRCVFVMNKAFLYKCSRHFGNERTVQWMQVISKKYGEEGVG